ncbi:polysaccharide export protein [Parvularcula sp. ZS-1/3]|uniref:Polysaccharide export protein n=2 Tax=Parvularcula mediterranea TaxID=2732508 RepID=A0A7Y3W5F9_9PROT|nr:polysaccharide export protein [Parvularcula mediterranea]
MTMLRPQAIFLTLGALMLAACAGITPPPSEGISRAELQGQEYPEYVIGPYDELQVFVWQAPELSQQARVRPDGRISTPLVEDMVAAGKSPTELAADIEDRLTEFVRTPEVTVIVTGFSSTFDQQIRVLGEAQRPAALPYQAGMTTLDVMIAVGGLTEFAAGNRAKLIRGRDGEKQTYKLRLGDLLRKGDVTADVPLQPGDVILIPDSIF